MTIETCAWWMWYWPHENYEGCLLTQGEPVDWTCNEATRAGDLALVYVKRPTSAIVALLKATTDAVFDREAGEFTTHLFCCEGEVASVFEKPVTIQTLRPDPWLQMNWGLLRGNFQPPGGKPPSLTEGIIQRLIQHIPELKGFVPAKLRRDRKALPTRKMGNPRA